VSAPQDEWRQIAVLHRVDALKGALKPNPAWQGALPWIHAKPARPGRYLAAYPKRGDYLVFLRRAPDGEGERWTTTASFHLDYRPDAKGRIEGRIIAGHERPQSVPVATIRQLLRRIIAVRPDAPSAARTLDPILKRASLFGTRNLERSVPHPVRLREIAKMAIKIRRGTLRSDVEKMFPEEDGGISGPGSTRYYVGSEVMVEAPYAQSRGVTRVSGPLRVYRSFPHYD
jgi:hypothetical protein